MKFWRFAWFWALAVAALAGCASPLSKSAPSLPPLPPEALFSLDELQPPVVRPLGSIKDFPPTDAVRELLDQAQFEYDQDQYADALATLKQAAELDGDSLAVKRLMGLCYASVGDAAQATEQLRPVVQQAGDDARVQMLWGSLLQVSGRGNEAGTAYRTSLICSDIDNDPITAAECRALLAGLLTKQGKFSAALQCYRQLANLLDAHGEKLAESNALGDFHTRPEILMLAQARLLDQLRRHEQAAELAEAAYRRNKTFAPAAETMVGSLLKAGLYDRAEDALLQLLRGPLDPARTFPLIAETYSSSGDSTGPVRLLNRYKKYHAIPAAEPLLAMAEAARQLGATSEAIDMLRSHSRSVEGAEEVMLRLAQWLVEDGQLPGALDAMAGLLVEDRSAARQVSTLIATVPIRQVDEDFLGKWIASPPAGSPALGRHYVAGMLASRAGLETLAAQQLSLAIDDENDFQQAYEALIALHVRGEQFDKAGEVAQLATEQVSEPFFGEYLRGWVHLQAGDVQLALDSLRLAVRDNPEHAPSRRLLGMAYLAAGQFPLAEQHLRHAVQTGADEQAAELLVSRYLGYYYQSRRQGEHAEALRWLRQARLTVDRILRDDQRNITALRLLAVVQRSAGGNLSARKTLDKLVSLAGDDAKVLMLKVRVELRQSLANRRIGRRRFERARADLLRIGQLDPDNRNAARLLAEVYRAYGDLSASAAVLAKLHEQDPNDTDVAFEYAAALHRTGDSAKAADVMVEIAESLTAKNKRLFYVAVMLDGNRRDQALALLNRRIEADDEDKLAYRLALAFVANGVDFAELAKDATSEASILVQACELAAFSGNEQELERRAVEWLDSVPASEWGSRGEQRKMLPHPFKASYPFENARNQKHWNGVLSATDPVQLAVAHHIVKGRFSQAERFAIEQIDRLTAQGGDAAALAGRFRSELVRRLFVAGKKKRARKLLDRFIAEDGENVLLLTQAQFVYDETDQADFERIVALLRRAVELSSDDPEVVNNLGYMLANRGLELEEADRMLTKALSEKPRASIQDSLGWTKYKKGQFSEAIRLLLAALNQPAGDSAVIYDHVGDTYWRLGQAEKAVEMWTEAADLAEAQLRDDSGLVDADTRRVARQATEKFVAVEAGRQPKVAEAASEMIDSEK